MTDLATILQRFNVNVIGNGKQPLMFVHGLIGDQRIWRYIVSDFTAKYKVILFDLMGCGNSDFKEYDKQKYQNLEGYAEDIINICEALKLKKVIYIGHSIACMIGLIACIHRPEYFSKMIFIAPSPSFVNDGNYVGGFEQSDVRSILSKIETDYISWAKQIAPIILNTPGKPELEEELIDILLSRNRESGTQFATTTFFADYRKELLKLKTPSLIVQCSEDIMAPLQVGDYLHAHLDKSVLKVISAKGHFPQLSAPQELTHVIKNYLKRSNET